MPVNICTEYLKNGSGPGETLYFYSIEYLRRLGGIFHVNFLIRENADQIYILFLQIQGLGVNHWLNSYKSGFM